MINVHEHRQYKHEEDKRQYDERQRASVDDALALAHVYVAAKCTIVLFHSVSHNN